MSDEEKTKKENGQKRETPFLEWVFAVIGLILVVSVIGFLVYNVAVNEGKSAELNIEVEEIVQNNKGFLVKFVLENTGDETAADVTIEGKLKKGEESVETGDVTVDYVPSHSKKKGGMFFTENPHNFDLQIHAKGFNEP